MVRIANISNCYRKCAAFSRSFIIQASIRYLFGCCGRHHGSADRAMEDVIWMFWFIYSLTQIRNKTKYVAQGIRNSIVAFFSSSLLFVCFSLLAVQFKANERMKDDKKENVFGNPSASELLGANIQSLRCARDRCVVMGHHADRVMRRTIDAWQACACSVNANAAPAAAKQIRLAETGQRWREDNQLISSHLKSHKIKYDKYQSVSSTVDTLQH